MDREKVIKGWECHMEADTLGCADCPYRQGWRTCNFADTLFNDVYALLKEQESLINFLNHQREKGHWIFGDSNGHSWMKCSQCLVSQDGQTACFSFCPNCVASMEEEPEHMT